MTARRILLPFTIPYDSLQRVEDNPEWLCSLVLEALGALREARVKGNITRA